MVETMWIDVSELHSFYTSDLGTVVQQVLEKRIRQFWPDARGENIAAYGYGTPYLDLFRDQNARTFALMPAHLGAIHWPQGRPNLTVLCEKTLLPLADQSLDRLMIVHALEYMPQPCELLREAWRVLVDGGKLLIIAPNRRGLWARTVSTPFGYGQPYTGYQLFKLVEDNSFAPEKPRYGLYMPPAAPQFLGSLCDKFENYGRRWSKKLGGVVMLEAQKTVMATVSPETSRWGSYIFVPQPYNVKQ